MLQSQREEAERKLQILLSPRKNGLDFLFKEVGFSRPFSPVVAQCSATPASVAATPPPLVARHLLRGSLTCDTPGSSRATSATGPFRGV